jgi:hypothetical protein
MKKKLTYLLFGIIPFLFPPNLSLASHYYGGSIETLCMAGCTLQVKVTLQADCQASINAPATNYSFFWEPTAGCTPPTQITPWQAAPLIEISPICPSAIASCAPTANVPATWQTSFTAQFEYCSASPCVFTPVFTQCCRDDKIVSIPNPAGSVFAITGTALDLGGLGCNSSPVFHYPTPLYITTTQSNQMYVGGIDPDGDSLVYQLGPAQTNTGTSTSPAISPATYNSGFSGTVPFGPDWQVSLNSKTGLLTATPSPGSINMSIANVYTYEYRTGVLIGVSNREIALYSSPLMGTNLGPIISSPTNLVGMQAIGGDSFIVCASGMVGFDIPFSDPNNDTVRVSWDGILGTGTFFDANNPTSTNNFAGVSPTGRFQFTPPAPGIFQFRVIAQDVVCPLGLRSDAVYTLIVGTGLTPPPTISVSGNIGACFSSPATLSVPGGYSSYLWSNGQTTPSISTNIPGIYGVTVSSVGGCPLTDTAMAVMAPGSYIHGNITTHLGAPLANQPVLLIEYDAVPGTLTSLDTVITDANGYYLFCNFTAPVVLVKAIPDSATYPMDLPTYADTAIFWYDAVQFNGPSVQATVNFSTRSGSNPGGPGFIGGFVSLGANKTAGVGDPIANLFLAIEDSATGTILSVAHTDANGYFRVGNLPNGTYRILADWPGIQHIDSVPLIQLSSNQSHRDSLLFKLHSTYLEWMGHISSTENAIGNFDISIFPNPSHGTVRLAGLPDSPTAWIGVRDLQGKLVFRMQLAKGQDQCLLGLGHLPKGMYSVEWHSPSHRWVHKLILD